MSRFILMAPYIHGNFIFPAVVEKVGNGVNVEGSGDRDRHEWPEDEDEVELVLREREQGYALKIKMEIWIEIHKTFHGKFVRFS